MSGSLTRFGLAVETAEQRKEKILAGVMASVYRQVPQSVLVSIVGAFALVMVLWYSMNQNLLMGWFMLILLESLARVRVAYKFRHAAEVVEEVQRWANRWVVLAVVAGALWGAAGFLFFSQDQPLHQVVLVAVVLSVAFPGVIGCIQATEALKILLEVGEPLLGRLLLYDALAMRFDEVILPRDPGCPLCSPGGTIVELQDYPAFCGTRRGQEAAPVEEIGASDLKRRLAEGEPLEIIDVREPKEWAFCRIEGARLVPLGSLRSRIHELDPARTYVLQCRSGVRSARALGLLRQAGFPRLLNLRGGILAWAREVDPTMPMY